jgi:hypothetical protein
MSSILQNAIQQPAFIDGDRAIIAGEEIELIKKQRIKEQEAMRID